MRQRVAQDPSVIDFVIFLDGTSLSAFLLPLATRAADDVEFILVVENAATRRSRLITWAVTQSLAIISSRDIVDIKLHSLYKSFRQSRWRKGGVKGTETFMNFKVTITFNSSTMQWREW